MGQSHNPGIKIPKVRKQRGAKLKYSKRPGTKVQFLKH